MYLSTVTVAKKTFWVCEFKSRLTEHVQECILPYNVGTLEICKWILYVLNGKSLHTVFIHYGIFTHATDAHNQVQHNTSQLLLWIIMCMCGIQLCCQYIQTYNSNFTRLLSFFLLYCIKPKQLYMLHVLCVLLDTTWMHNWIIYSQW